MSPQHLGNADLHSEVRRREKASRADAAERLALIAEIDRRHSFEDDGFTSTTSWLKANFRISGGEARRWVELARRLAELPEVAQALGDGDISFDHARLLAQAAIDYPVRFDVDHKVLIDAARDLSPHSLRRALDHWKSALEPEHFEGEQERAFEKRRLSASVTIGGMVRLDGDLDPESGEVVMTALRALTDPPQRDLTDTRNAQQRRADALTEICRDFLDSGLAARTGGEKPHVTLTVDLATLERRAGRRCELDATGVVSPETARRLACDAGLSRVITAGDSEPLDVGRRTRTVPPAIRRALTVRDGGCTAQGCDRPARWADAHHVVHWVDGGPTSVDNLVLLCRRHHRAAHGKPTKGRELPQGP